MSVAEMKIEAINQITRLTEESSLKEIVEHLSKLNKQKELNLHSITMGSKVGCCGWRKFDN